MSVMRIPAVCTARVSVYLELLLLLLGGIFAGVPRVLYTVLFRREDSSSSCEQGDHGI